MWLIFYRYLYYLDELNCGLILTNTTESKLETVKENCLKRSRSLKAKSQRRNLKKYYKNHPQCKDIKKKRIGYTRLNIRLYNFSKSEIRLLNLQVKFSQ